MTQMNPDIEELKRSQAALEAKLNDLIQRHPALRRAEAEANIQRLRVKHEELTNHLAALVQVHPTKLQFLFMPAGVHEITPISGGRWEVIVDERTAAQVEGTRMAASGRGKLPYFDLNHEDDAVSFYPSEFFWRDNVGVICRGVLTEAGDRAVVSGEYKYFSPRFCIDKREGPPYRVTCVLGEANMGAIAYAAAFGELLKLDIKRSDGFYY